MYIKIASSLFLCNKKKYKIKFSKEECHMYIKNASSLFLCSKKVQNQIYPERISHVHQKCVFTLPLQQKKYKIKFTQDEYHMYIRVVQGRTLLPWSLKYKNYIPVWVQWWYSEQHSLSFEIERRLWNILSWLKSFDHFARINFFLIRQWAHALFNKQQ